jgi:hypothetical protein
MIQHTSISQKEFVALHVGDIIYYLLSLADKPTNPEREWKGRITLIRQADEYTCVSLLDEGYEVYSDEVYRPQIVRYERAL